MSWRIERNEGWRGGEDDRGRRERGSEYDCEEGGREVVRRMDRNEGEKE
jgi:hypothetical protein